jgi:hypothetical protein
MGQRVAQVVARSDSNGKVASVTGECENDNDEWRR